MNRQYVSKIILKPFHDNTYISTLPVVKYLMDKKELCFENAVTFFAGENGTGKSTLIGAIAVACGFNAEGGTKNFNFSTQHTTSNLGKYLTISKKDHEKDGFFLRAESFYNVASNIDAIDKIPAAAPPVINSYGGKSLHEQSHGESFLALVQNRFRGNGLYILDEPESALSPLRQMTLLSTINNLVKKNSQFIIATHSPILLAYPGARIYQTSDEGIEQVSYEKCGHYELTKRFLNDHEQMIKYLFEE